MVDPTKEQIMQDIEQIEGFMDDTRERLDDIVKYSDLHKNNSQTLMALIGLRDSAVEHYLEQRDQKHEQYQRLYGSKQQ